MVETFDLAIEHALATLYRSVDGTATRRIKAVMEKKGWRDVTLVTVDYGRYDAGVDRCVSVYRYEIRHNGGA